MSARSLLFAAALSLPVLASCAAQDIAPERTARGEALLAQRLAGKVAGPPVACLSRYRSADMEVIDSDTLLFRDGRTTYRQDTNGSCYPRGSKIGYTLVTRSLSGGQYCDGDIAQVMDSSTGAFVGSCSFNAFVPFRQP